MDKAISLDSRKRPVLVDKLVDLEQIPNQCLFAVQPAARFLGVHEQTLRKYTDEGQLQARRLGDRRVYTLEELRRFIDSLPQWYDPLGENPRIAATERRN